MNFGGSSSASPSSSGRYSTSSGGSPSDSKTGSHPVLFSVSPLGSNGSPLGSTLGAKGEERRSCPVNHSSKPAEKSCPVNHNSQMKVGGCPVNHSQDSTKNKINPLNQMPEMSQDASPNQGVALSKSREISSIPKDSGLWEYPSPQQFYNALIRKGKETPSDSVESMVDIHNFLNESSWHEILKWEKRYSESCGRVSLDKFEGKPDTLSPRAWFFSTFWGHDWTVNRCGKQVRYVLDYYTVPSEPGSPAFSVDVRPALDSFGSLFDRIRNYFD